MSKKVSETTDEYTKAIEDRDWWREVAAAMGAKRVCGFNDRDFADIVGPDGISFECPGWLGHRILGLIGPPI